MVVTNNTRRRKHFEILREQEIARECDVGENLCKTSISPGFDLNEFRKGLIKDLSASICDELLGRKIQVGG
ncbi:unnamed protein product [Rhizophagus irregularis]|nr:unnamed protein product [Rhizophagus irregularis]